MANIFRFRLLRAVYQGRFLILLVALLIYFALVPLLEGLVRIRILIDIIFSAILLTGIYAVSTKTYNAVIATLLALPMLISLWVSYFFYNPTLIIVGNCFSILFFAFAILIIIAFVFESQQVTRDVICAAVVVYLFIGVVWSGIFLFMENLQPGSFSMGQRSFENKGLLFNYFSFTTLTTLGYGDITPLTGQTKAIAVLEAIIGQIYLTVLVARLVGLHISQSRNRTSG